MVENVVERRSELTNPPVANIDQVTFLLAHLPTHSQQALNQHMLCRRISIAPNTYTPTPPHCFATLPPLTYPPASPRNPQKLFQRHFTAPHTQSITLICKHRLVVAVQMLLVFSLDRPPWDGQMATRFLVSAEASDLSVTVLLNKADLVTEETRAYVKKEVQPTLPHSLSPTRGGPYGSKLSS